jgi:enoyl-CoA hydratase/carnithine racemase
VTGTNEVRTDWAADGVFRVTLDRPAKRNAFTPEMVDALDRFVAWAAGAPAVRAVIVTGASGTFSAGADLAEFAAGGARAAEFVRRGNRMVAALTALGKPVIAAVDGPALGGGFEVALACPLRIASHRAVFGLPEVTLGLIPAWGGVPNLVRACGPGRALGVCLAAQPLSAADALALGIVQRAVPPEELTAVATELAVRVAGWSPVAVAAILELARATGDPGERELALFETALAQPEAGAALARFLARRAGA